MLLKLAVLGAAALAIPLMAQESPPAPPAVAAFSLANTPAERDRRYALHAHEGDIYEIEASRLAIQRSRDRQIRFFAQAMINHHTRSMNELARLARSATRTSAADLSEPKSQMLDTLRSSSAAEFDANYVQGQIAAHEEALALYRAYLATGSDSRLRAFAGQGVPLVEQHLVTARSLRTTAR